MKLSVKTCKYRCKHCNKLLGNSIKPVYRFCKNCGTLNLVGDNGFHCRICKILCSDVRTREIHEQDCNFINVRLRNGIQRRRMSIVRAG